MNEELIEELKKWAPYLVVAALAVGGWYGFKQYRAAQKVAIATAASEAVNIASRPASGEDAQLAAAGELEGVIARESGSPAEGVMKLMLAKKYYSAGQYQQAYDTYAALAANEPKGSEGVCAVGMAQCEEALGKFAEAQKSFDEFAAANPAHFLADTAKIGAARCLAEAGNRDEAAKRVEALKKELKADDALAKARVEQLEDFVKRYRDEAPAVPATAPAPAVDAPSTAADKK